MAKKSSKKQDESSSAKIGDARFANFESDPRFRLPKKNATKTTIDSRFKRMLKDDEFTASAKVDKYGRKLKADNKKKALKNLYKAVDDDDTEVEADDVVERELSKADVKYDPARGGGFSSSDSESESEEEGEGEEEDDEGDGGAAVGTLLSMQRLPQEQVGVEDGEVTRRIAIVNLDWDHIKSQDLMALFSGFVPKGGRIERISIFPSEFGKERMQREELEGPPKEIFKSAKSDDEDDSENESEAGSESDEEDTIKKDLLAEGDDLDFNSDALRSYQLDRLRYYYAVMMCSDKNTAEKIYQATDGTEYQTSSNFLDLRFVPDDVTFDDEPRDECDSVPSSYKPTEFVTDALQHSKVKLTWDMDPAEATRKEDIKRAFSGSRAELQENDMRAYLASDSEGEDDHMQGETEEAEDQPKLSKKELERQKMREALGLTAEPSSKPSKSKSQTLQEMEITFAPEESEADKKAKKSADVQETTAEAYIRKERERKAAKKEKALAKRHGEEASNVPNEENSAQQEDLGFDDPFFTADKPVKTSKSAQRKEERLKKREQKEAEAAQTAAQKAQLERIMADDSKDAVEHLDHFDMNEIARAEKQQSKKGKKKKKQKDKEDHGGLQEGFQMDVGDDRFKAVFESHEFAIDPSDPKFKATPGMKQLLEERRKKRDNDDDESSTRQKKKVRKH